MPRFLLGALGLLALASQAQAQLDLPKSGERTKPAGNERPNSLPLKKDGARGGRRLGNTAPFMECSVCFERNYVTRIDPSAKDGMQKAWCQVCQTPRTHKHRAPGGATSGGGLDLPSDPARGTRAFRPDPLRTAPAATPGASQPGGAGGAATAPGVDLRLLEAGHRIFQGLARVKRMDSDAVLHAPDQLLALGEGGLAPARVALASDHGPTLIVAVRTLLRAGKGEDADQVVQRLRARLPARAAAAAVDELVVRDPVRASPELLCRLLAHPQIPVRNAASQALANVKPGPNPGWLPLLQPVLESSSGDARLRAVDLLIDIEGPEAGHELFRHLDDPRGKVVARVAQALARSTDPGIEQELLTRAFQDRWILRSNACALLALIEREDQRFRPILTGDHAGPLLRGLASSDPFVSGVCGAALAGIGFRDRSPETPEWMRRDVPEQLVAIVTGIRFFSDHEAVQPVAQRRLQQISGVALGADGPAWASWWVEAQPTFRAARAELMAELSDATEMRVVWTDQAQGTGFQLLGSDRLGSAVPEGPSEVLYLDADQSKELFTRLQEEGVFGAERLPGPRGSRVGRGRQLSIFVGGGAKSFRYGARGGDAWFERIATALDALRTTNRWQGYPHPERHGSQVKLVEQAQQWWSETDDQVLRARALADLVLDWLATADVTQREIGLRELEQLYRDPELDVATEGDFGRLMARLREETFFANRAGRLVDLAMLSGGLSPAEDGPGVEGSALALGQELIATIYERFGDESAEAIAKVLGSMGRAPVLAAASDTRPLLRGIAAGLLAMQSGSDELAALESLLDDPSLGVQIAAIEACGRGEVQALLPAILKRARMSEPDVRRVALEAVGRLGGTESREVLLTTLTEPGGAYRTEAALGLAELGDPRVAAVLVGLLREGRNSDTWLAARRGLLDLGSAAHDELYSALRSADGEVRREAALLLARQMVPTAANSLLRVLSEDPTDQLAETELVILSCVDYRSVEDSLQTWWDWWDRVTHDDPFPWFIAAAEIRSLPAPQPLEEHFGAKLSRDAWLFLAEVLRRPEPWLVERARREIERRSGRPVGQMPTKPSEREAWIQALVEVVLDQAED